MNGLELPTNEARLARTITDLRKARGDASGLRKWALALKLRRLERAFSSTGRCVHCFGLDWLCDRHPELVWSGVTNTLGCEPGCIGPGIECDLCGPSA